jgi:hypothetical protein
MSVRLSKTLELQPILDETLRTAAAIEGTDLGLLSLCDAGRTRLEIRASIGFDEAFLAVANNVEPEGGLGLGLTLARSLVQMHGGRITAASAGPGFGSEFVVRLPVVDERRRPRSDINPGECESLPTWNVLVVDDSQSAQFVLGKLLDKIGQRVRMPAPSAASSSAGDGTFSP